MTNVALFDPDMRRFYSLAKIAGVEDLFDFVNHSCHAGRLELYLKSATGGDKYIVEFLLSLWRGDSTVNIDLSEANELLNDNQREVIREWYKAPFTLPGKD